MKITSLQKRFDKFDAIATIDKDIHKMTTEELKACYEMYNESILRFNIECILKGIFFLFDNVSEGHLSLKVA